MRKKKMLNKKHCLKYYRLDDCEEQLHFEVTDSDKFKKIIANVKQLY